MSTILKALKQSEARRPRDSSLPGSLPSAARARPPRTALPWIIAAGLAAAVGVGGWLLWPVDGTTRSGPEPKPRRVSEVSMPERPATSARAPGKTGAGAGTGSPRAGGNQSRNDNQGTGESRPTAGNTDPAPVESPGTQTKTPVAADGPAVQDEPRTETDPPAKAGKEPEPALESYALLPRLEHLPAPRRDALPKLRLNAHVYAPAPGQSFVLINLSRYREGDRVAPGLTVAEIFPGGVVMDDGKGRFVLPRP